MSGNSGDLLNMLAYIASNEENIEGCVLAFARKPTEDEPNPNIDMLTMGENAVQLFGMCELIKLEVYSNLNANNQEEGEEDA